MKFLYVLPGLNAIVSFVFTINFFREELKEDSWLGKIVGFPFLWFFFFFCLPFMGVVLGTTIFFESLIGMEAFDKLLETIGEIIVLIFAFFILLMIVGNFLSLGGALLSL
jgi:hypothetical protein